jgi:hypothetical protein
MNRQKRRLSNSQAALDFAAGLASDESAGFQSFPTHQMVRLASVAA